MQFSSFLVLLLLDCLSRNKVQELENKQENKQEKQGRKTSSTRETLDRCLAPKIKIRTAQSLTPKIEIKTAQSCSHVELVFSCLIFLGLGSLKPLSLLPTHCKNWHPCTEIFTDAVGRCTVGTLLLSCKFSPLARGQYIQHTQFDFWFQEENYYMGFELISRHRY